MRLLRSVVNQAFRVIYKGMDTAHPDDISFYFNAASKLAPMGKRHRALVKSRMFRDTVYLISRAVADTPYGKPLKLPEPIFISVATSDFCPLACSNCYSNSLPVRRQSSTSKSLDMFHVIAKTRTPYIIITGGEPMLDKELNSKLLTLLKAGKQVIVSTNLSVAALEDLAHAFPGQIQFFLPLWGDPKSHDLLRGRGSYERMIENISLSEQWPCIRTLYVLLESPKTRILEEAVKIGNSATNLEVRVSRKFNVGRLDYSNEVCEKIYTDYIRSHYSALQREFTLVQIDIPELSFKTNRMRQRILSWLIGVEPFDSCGAGNRLVHISASGSVYPCYAFEQTEFAAPEMGTGTKPDADVIPQFGGIPVAGKCAAEIFDGS